MIAPTRRRPGSIAAGAAANRPPRLPSDAQDDGSNRQSDQGVCERETDCDCPSRRNDREAHVSIGARVVPVSNERRTANAPTSSCANPSSQVVAAEPNCSGSRDDGQVGRLRRLNQAPNGLDAYNGAADTNCGDDDEPGAPLGALRAEHERNRKRCRSQGIANVVDEISKKRDTPARREHHRLRGRCGPQDSQRTDDRSNAFTRPFDALIDQSVRMAMLVPAVLAARVAMVSTLSALRLGVRPTDRC